MNLLLGTMFTRIGGGLVIMILVIGVITVGGKTRNRHSTSSGISISILLSMEAMVNPLAKMTVNCTLSPRVCCCGPFS